MPEGDSVHRLAERLAPAVGRMVTGCQLRVPRLAVADLTGSRLASVRARGKHLLMSFRPADGTGEWTLHTHLRMDGSWRVHPAGLRWSLPAHTARVVLRLSGVGGGPEVELVGHDLGLVELWPSAQYQNRLGWLGPDPLEESEWADGGRDEAVRRAGTQPDRPVGVTLMDQSVIAGVGNEYRAEVCFLSGVHPARPTGRAQAAAMIDLAARLMRANRRRPFRVTTGDSRRGHRTFVFGRNHRPCRRCGTLIRSGSLGPADQPDEDRIIWWCPACQR